MCHPISDIFTCFSACLPIRHQSGSSSPFADDNSDCDSLNKLPEWYSIRPNEEIPRTVFVYEPLWISDDSASESSLRSRFWEKA